MKEESTSTELRHAKSQKDFPNLKLEDDEYVELAFRRTRVILILIWAGIIGGILILILLATMTGVFGGKSNMLGFDATASGFLVTLLLALCAVLVVIGLVATYVYNGNKMYVTNRRLMQERRVALFADSKDVIDLISIEDVSFKQTGIVQHILKYGTIRMATVGDETTYTFPFVDTPMDELDTITHLVHVEKEKQKNLNQQNQ